MNSIFGKTNNKSMIPESLQPFTDRIGVTLTGLAAYINIKIGFLGLGLPQFVLSPTFNSLLAIIISLLSILWIMMKIYDQFITTKLKKEAMQGANSKTSK